MKTFQNNIRFIPIVMFLIILVSVLYFPKNSGGAVVIVIFISLAIAISSIFKKHKKTYLEGKITRGNLIRNVSLEILGILLAMILAGLAGRTLAQIVTSPIANELTKLITGIVIGIFVGVIIGLLVKKTWGRLVA